MAQSDAEVVRLLGEEAQRQIPHRLMVGQSERRQVLVYQQVQISVLTNIGSWR